MNSCTASLIGRAADSRVSAATFSSSSPGSRLACAAQMIHTPKPTMNTAPTTRSISKAICEMCRIAPSPATTRASMIANAVNRPASARLALVKPLRRPLRNASSLSAPGYPAQARAAGMEAAGRVHGPALLPADADISRPGPLPPVAVALVRRSCPSRCLLDNTRLTAEQIRSVDLIIEEAPYTEHATGPRDMFPEGDIDVTVTTLG